MNVRNAVLIVVATLFALPACSAIRRSEAQSAEDLLVAAGFRIQMADSPDSAAKLAQMKPVLRVVPRDKDGEVVYTYADPYNCQCVYVGGEEAYARYRRLALEKQIADERVEAAEAEESAAMNMQWYWW